MVIINDVGKRPEMLNERSDETKAMEGKTGPVARRRRSCCDEGGQAAFAEKRNFPIVCFNGGEIKIEDVAGRGKMPTRNFVVPATTLPNLPSPKVLLLHGSAPRCKECRSKVSHSWLASGRIKIKL
ncbi:hypothetical protein VTH06DRAFT_4587 [Thermothelomyces fergusii]